MSFKRNIFVLLSLVVIGMTSCDSIFDDFAQDKLPEDLIWTDQQLIDGFVLPWYRNMSNGFSIYMPTNALIRGLGREYMPWYADQIAISKSEWYSAAYGDILKSDVTEIKRRALSLWNTYYEQIRSVNLLFQHQAELPGGDFKNRVLGEAHFFRGYYYYMLWRQFGGVLISTEVYDPLKNPKKTPRASYQEMVDFITAEADLSAKYLENINYSAEDKGRITRGTALMLKAKTFFWAAGDHFQNQEKSYLGFSDNQTTAMLSKAKEAYDDLMKLGYSLVPVTGTTQSDIAQSYRNIFLTKNSEESILEVQHANDGNYSTGFGHKLDRESSSPYYGGTTAAYTPTQNHVDEYGMQKGFTYNPQAPYKNRDFRFYANVLYDSCMFRGHTMEIHYNKVNGVEKAAADLTPYDESATSAVSKTGYYLGKFVDETQRIDNNETTASKQNYIIWRYAEVLLDYAEIEYKLGNLQSALDKVNQIRRRAHMYDLETITWEAILNERRVEMAFEETTYWDLLRYNVAVQKMSGATNPVKVMKIVKQEGKPTTFTISNMDKYPSRVRLYRDMQYYYPIPWDEIRYQGIDQNPEWIE
jgi:hypothetical protein